MPRTLRPKPDANTSPHLSVANDATTGDVARPRRQPEVDYTRSTIDNSTNQCEMDAVMNALRMMIRPIRHGWAVQLNDGRELARFLGPGARWRAMRHLRRTVDALRNSGPAPGAAGVR
jgi:hypothetical protein